METPLRCLRTEFLVLEVLYLSRSLETPLRCLCAGFLALEVPYLMRGLSPRSIAGVLDHRTNPVFSVGVDSTSSNRCTS